MVGAQSQAMFQPGRAMPKDLPSEPVMRGDLSELVVVVVGAYWAGVLVLPVDQCHQHAVFDELEYPWWLEGAVKQGLFFEPNIETM